LASGVVSADGKRKNLSAEWEGGKDAEKKEKGQQPARRPFWERPQTRQEGGRGEEFVVAGSKGFKVNANDVAGSKFAEKKGAVGWKKRADKDEKPKKNDEAGPVYQKRGIFVGEENLKITRTDGSESVENRQPWKRGAGQDILSKNLLRGGKKAKLH